MDRKYPLIAAAIAAAFAGHYASAAAPTVSTAATSTATLVIAGSSAAQSSIANSVENDICGGASNTLVVESSGNKNFYAYSCNSANAVGTIASGTLITIYYRSEGGSVVGALPVANEVQIKRIDLSNTSCSSSGNTGTCPISGVTSVNGPADSWSVSTTSAFVQLGVTDVEPAQFHDLNYPSNYSTTAFGPHVSAGTFGGLAKSPAIQQVFGLGVNTSGVTLNTTANGSGVNLSRESEANILLLNYTEWFDIPDAVTGAPIATASTNPVTRIDREPGSGTRTSASIYFLNYGCGSTSGIANASTTEALNYATGDELNAANATPGAIAYASIDNLLPPKNTSYTNLVLATLNGVTPSTLAAAAGEYDYWYEATLIDNNTTVSGVATQDANAQQIAGFLISDVPKLSKAPIAADVNVIPGKTAFNTAGTVPLTVRNGTISGTYTGNIYLNPFTRSLNSCSVPGETNE
jgi:hypothetical protein